MAKGPGKYDDLATYVRTQSNGAAVIVIVIDGAKGSGFSVQTEDPVLVQHLPELLRDTAMQIENSQKETRQ
jgi:hypothetical protein